MTAQLYLRFKFLKYSLPLKALCISISPCTKRQNKGDLCVGQLKQIFMVVLIEMPIDI